MNQNMVGHVPCGDNKKEWPVVWNVMTTTSWLLFLKSNISDNLGNDPLPQMLCCFYIEVRNGLGMKWEIFSLAN